MDDPQQHAQPLQPFMGFSAHDMLMTGLRIMYTEKRINNVNGNPHESKTNNQRFKDHYGASCYVMADIWRDMQIFSFDLLPCPENPIIHPKKLAIEYFLEAAHFLYRYKRECEREALFDKSPKTLRTHCWYYLQRIQALKSHKIVFPVSRQGDDVWLLSVDGTHCRINDPTHPEFSQDSKYFSHKWNHAALNYELGVSLFESKILWINGPFPAGTNDNKVFADYGLKEKLRELGMKAVADKGYNGHPEQCSTFNAYDSEPVKMLKARAQMRHEQVNGIIHEFQSMDDCFRHGEEKHKICFEAVCVITQYRMDHGEQLYDVLAGIKEI